MLKFIYKLLGSHTGLSSKRLVTVVTFILICIISITDLFTLLTISLFIFNGLMYLCSIGLGTILALNVIDKNKYDINKEEGWCNEEKIVDIDDSKCN